MALSISSISLWHSMLNSLSTYNSTFWASILHPTYLVESLQNNLKNTSTCWRSRPERTFRWFWPAKSIPWQRTVQPVDPSEWVRRSVDWFPHPVDRHCEKQVVGALLSRVEKWAGAFPLPWPDGIRALWCRRRFRRNCCKLRISGGCGTEREVWIRYVIENL